MVVVTERPQEGDFCYVGLAGRGTFEGEVVSAGKDYKIRLKTSDELVEVPNSEVWTAPPMEAIG